MAFPQEAESDAALALAARQGSQAAFRELVRRFERPVFSLVLRLVRDRALAEDLSQECFVKAWRALGSYDPQRKLASWLLKIAHNTAIDFLKSHGRKYTDPHADALPAPGPHPDAGRDPRPMTPDGLPFIGFAPGSDRSARTAGTSSTSSGRRRT